MVEVSGGFGGWERETEVMMELPFASSFKALGVIHKLGRLFASASLIVTVETAYVSTLTMLSKACLAPTQFAVRYVFAAAPPFGRNGGAVVCSSGKKQRLDRY